MERKLVKQGRNALTVTLPAQWLKARGLAAGNSVAIEEDGRRLIIGSSRAASKTAVTLDLVGCERSMMYHLLLAKYIEGYDEITIRHEDCKTVQEIAHSLIGIVVEEHTASRTVLRSIISVPEDNFAAVLRRAAHMFLEQARLVEATSRGIVGFADVKAQEQLLDQNLLYCLRYLNKYENRQSAYRYFLICSTIELAADQLSRISRYIGKRSDIGQLIAKAVADYTALLFKNDFKKLYASLRAFRNAVPQKTFLDGLVYTLAEILYNYIGYVVDAENGRR
jgi:antitoxin component of MazEF toxin-antitoxin module